MSTITLPTEKAKALKVSPGTVLLYAKPKQGKTTALSLLENALSIDTEDGSDFVESMRVKVDTSKPDHEQAEEFVNILRAIYMSGYDKETKIYTPKYKYLIIDTFTRLDTWSEYVGTLNYMGKMQGKKFNVLPDGSKIHPTSKDFETVHEIAQGFGYKHSREVMLDWYDKIRMLAPVVIFVCHVKDKLISTGLGEAVSTRDINLTGKVRDIVAGKVDTIMYCYREGRKLMVSFEGEDGTRCPYLSGKNMILTESDETGKIITNNWNQIFID